VDFKENRSDSKNSVWSLQVSKLDRHIDD